jgi:hypothetical protein
MKTPTISYEDIDYDSIRIGLMSHNELKCELSYKQAVALQSNFAKYHKYWESRSKSPGSIGTAFRGIVWIIHRALLHLKYEKCDCIVSAYTTEGYLMEPVDFNRIDDNSATLTFKRKKVEKN